MKGETLFSGYVLGCERLQAVRNMCRCGTLFTPRAELVIYDLQNILQNIARTTTPGNSAVKKPSISPEDLATNTSVRE